MKTIIQFIISIIFICFMSTNLWALHANQTINEDGQIEEIFYQYSDPDLIAVTSNPGGLLQPVPADVPYLYEPELAGGVAVLVKIRDRFNGMAGFASELEHTTTDETGIPVSEADWTFKIMGRGTLLVTQIKDITAVINLITDMVTTGELERYLDPPLNVASTLPGTGKIVGGTGEFAGARGTYEEYTEVYYVNLITGELGLNITHKMIYDDDNNNDQQ